MKRIILVLLFGVITLLTTACGASSAENATPTPNWQATVVALQQQTPMPSEPAAPTATPTPLSNAETHFTPTCPTEQDFYNLTGVVADRIPTEACAFHWRGDPQTITPKNACPMGWSCQLGIEGTGNVLYYDNVPGQVTIYAGTWRLVNTYEPNDPVQRPCDFLKKSQEEGAISIPAWTITAGNFTCP